MSEQNQNNGFVAECYLHLWFTLAGWTGLFHCADVFTTAGSLKTTAHKFTKRKTMTSFHNNFSFFSDSI